MFRHILVPLDGSLRAEGTIPHAVAFARTFASHITLIRAVTLAECTTTSTLIDPLEWRQSKEGMHDYLEEWTRRLARLNLSVDCRLLEGSPAEHIIQFAEESAVDLMVLSRHGASGSRGWPLGSVSHKILLRSYISTLLIDADNQPDVPIDLRYNRILAPLDGSRRAECALLSAKALTDAHHAKLILTHVARKPEMFAVPSSTTGDPSTLEQLLYQRNRREANKYLCQLGEQLGANCTEVHLLANDDVTTCLHDFIQREQIDLLVMSAHGHLGAPWRPFGPLVGSLIETCTTPLLLIQDLTAADRVRTVAETAASGEAGTRTAAENYAHVA